MLKQYKNPKTGVSKTSKEWTEELEYNSVKAFRNNLSQMKKQEREEDAYLNKAQRSKKQHQAKKIKNPVDGLWYTMGEAAKYLGISRRTLNIRISIYEEGSPKIWNKGKLKKESKPKMKDEIMITPEEKAVLDNIKIGTWEAAQL